MSKMKLTSISKMKHLFKQYSLKRFLKYTHIQQLLSMIQKYFNRKVNSIFNIFVKFPSFEHYRVLTATKMAISTALSLSIRFVCYWDDIIVTEAGNLPGIITNILVLVNFMVPKSHFYSNKSRKIIT